MKLNITSSVDMTPALETYARGKFLALEKILKQFEKDGEEVALWLELARSQHHKKGEVFSAIADAHLSKKSIHAEAHAESIRTAVDQVRDMLRMEIEKQREKLLPKRGKE